jgi:hypothetical protein
MAIVLNKRNLIRIDAVPEVVTQDFAHNSLPLQGFYLFTCTLAATTRVIERLTASHA